MKLFGISEKLQFLISGNYGKSALFFSITRNRDEIVIEFLKRGAKVKIVNNKGQTPLSLAVSHLKEETIKLIEEAEEAQKEVGYNDVHIFCSICCYLF